MDEWVKLSTRYYADTKIEALPDADTEVMFTRGLARAGELRLEGFIPEESLPKLARRRRYAASVEALLAAGLWTRVEGGFQVTNWDHWQDGLDALTKRRAADRERQRRRRASAGESTPDPVVSRDKQRPSRDMSRDVTRPEGERERDPRGTGRTTTYVARSPGPEPPPRCEQHLEHPTPGPCPPCGDARKALNQWHLDKARWEREAPKCPKHQGKFAHNCPLCRADQIGVTDE